MKKIVSVILICLVVTACGHTNDLGRYVLRGKKAFYETKISPKARTIEVKMKTGEKEKNEDKSDFEKVLEAGSEILSSQKIETLKDYVDTEHLANSITYRLEDALITFIDLKTVERKVDRPHFIVEVELKSCILNVYKNRSSVSVFATARINDTETGGIAWENWETYTIPFGGNYSNSKSENETEAKVLTAAKLLSLSKREVSGYVSETAEIVGEKMADTFREDYNDAIFKKVNKKEKPDL